MRPNMSTWTCGTCGQKEIPGTVKFCRRCAAAYSPPPAWTCPSCDGANPIDPIKVAASPQCGHCAYTLRPGGADNDEAQAASLAASSSRPLPAKSIPAPQPQRPPTRPTPSTSQAPTIELGGNRGGTAQQQVGQQSGAQIDVSKLGPPGFAWMCRAQTCNHVNEGNTAFCTECQGPIQPASWGCECGAVNYMLRNVCFSCNVPIRPTWLCMGCRSQTSVYEGQCRSCGEERKMVAGRGSGRGSRRAAGSGAGDWICSACRKMNHANRTECFGCELPKQTSDEMTGNAGQIQMVGDSNWTCRSCSAVNFRTRKSCWQCNAVVGRGGGAINAGIDDLDEASKPQIAKEGFQDPSTEDGPGHSEPKQRKVWLANDEKMEDSDWVCARCMHKNFRTSKDCFKCFAPKVVAPMSRVVVKPKSKNFKI